MAASTDTTLPAGGDGRTVLPPAALRLQRLAGVVGLAGIVLCLAALLAGGATRSAFFRAWEWAWLYWFGISAGSIAWVMIHHMVGGGWGRAIQRLAEASGRNVLLMAVLFIPLFFGLKDMFPWANHERVIRDPVLLHKSLYLNAGFWTARVIIYFVAFSGLAYLMSSLSRRYDQTHSDLVAHRGRQVSAAFLVVYVVFMTFVGVDLIMSREAHWFSNVYGFIMVVNQALSSIAFLIVTLTAFLAAPPLRRFVTRGHYNDLGNLLLTCTILWAYMNLAQFLIFWMGNMQEDLSWTDPRAHGVYGVISGCLITFHFFFPFFMLLSKGLKRRPELLWKVAFFVLCVRILDVFSQVWPTNEPGTPSVNRFWLNVAAPVGIGGVWLAAFLWQLGKAPLLADQAHAGPSDAMVHQQDPFSGTHGNEHAYPA